MSKSKLKVVTLAAVGLLVVANLFSWFFGDNAQLLTTEFSDATAHNQKSISRSQGRYATSAQKDNQTLSVNVPAWLQAEFEGLGERNTSETRDIFQWHVSDRPVIASLPDVDFDDNDKQPKPAIITPPKSREHPGDIKILAINLNGDKSSAMIEIQGKTKVVFVGDIVDKRYTVTGIQKNSVSFEDY